MIVTAFIMLLAVIVLLFVYMTNLEAAHQEERESWYIERKELMDRIQAPSFAEYKHNEVRVIKAQKEEPKTEQNFHLE